MQPEPIRFSDGDAYDRFMGVWSRLVGHAFLDWLAPPAGQHWLDVGCGNGAFTQLLAERTQPRSLHGVDPSEAQLVAARRHPALARASFELGDAMALPFQAASFDAAVMPLVLFFVPDPARGVAELARVVVPGGLVAAYSWDMTGGGFPYQRVRDGLGEAGVSTPWPPHPEVSRQEVQQELWAAAGLTAIESHTISVERCFADFDELWSILLAGPSVGQALTALAEEPRAAVQELLRARLQPAGDGSITLAGRAHAIRGRVPGG